MNFLLEMFLKQVEIVFVICLLDIHSISMFIDYKTDYVHSSVEAQTKNKYDM